MEATLRPAVRTAAAAGLVLVVAAALRYVAIVTIGDTPAPHGDEIYYVSAARALASGRGYPGAGRPPGFPALLALALRLDDGDLLAARIAQSLAGCVVALLVWDLARRAFGPKAGLISGLVCAVHPTLVHYGHFLWAETLYSALLLAAFWCLQRFTEARAARWVTAAGIAFGLATLTRGEFVVWFLPVVVVWLLRQAGAEWRRKGLIWSILLVVSCATVIAPWTWRNWRLLETFVPVATIRWFPVAAGNVLPETNWVFAPEVDGDFWRRYHAIPGALERERFSRNIALAAIRAEQPAWAFKKLVRGTYMLWTPYSQLAKFRSKGWLRDSGGTLAWSLVVLEAGVYVLHAVVGFWALWLVPDRRLKLLVVSYVVFTCVLHMITVADHRFRVPLLPLMSLYVGPLVTGTLLRVGRWRLAGAAACSLVFLAVVAVDLVAHPHHLAPGAESSETQEHRPDLVNQTGPLDGGKVLRPEIPEQTDLNLPP